MDDVLSYDVIKPTVAFIVFQQSSRAISVATWAAWDIPGKAVTFAAVTTMYHFETILRYKYDRS